MGRTSRVEAWWNIIKAKKMRDDGLTLQQIADVLDKTHTTIIYYLKKYNDYYKYDQEFRDMVKLYEANPVIPAMQAVIVSAKKVVEVCRKELGTGDEFLKIMRQLGIVI